MDLGSRVAPYLVDTGADVQITEALVPETLGTTEHKGVAYEVTEDDFLLRLPNGVRYRVQGGESISYHRPDGVSDREVALFLLGSAWGALCYQRGLLPLHASAVLAGGKVHAFTGASGAGKSTLSAALADRGYPFFTDDILIIDPAQCDEQLTCYSGQKDLKLWKDALELTRAEQGAAVRDAEDFEKYFATPRLSVESGSGSLASLSILYPGSREPGVERCQITPITGGNSVVRLMQSVYRPRYATAIWGRKRTYMVLAQLINDVHVQSFTRPFLREDFEIGLDFIDSWLQQQADAATGRDPG